MKCLSIVYPSGTKIANGEKTIEVRSWLPQINSNEDLLIIENNKFLRVDGDTDIGKPVAIVRVKAVRKFLESDIPMACASRWEPGYYSWELYEVRPLQSKDLLLAAKGIYEIDFKGLENESN